MRLRPIEDMRRDAEKTYRDRADAFVDGIDAESTAFIHARDVLDLLPILDAADAMREALDVARKSLESYVVIYDRTADAAKAERAIRESSKAYDAAKGATT